MSPTFEESNVIWVVHQLHSQVRRLMIYLLMSSSVWIKSKTLTKSLSILNVSTYWLNKFHHGSWLFASCPQRLHEVCDDNIVYVRDTLMPSTSLATCPSSLVWKQCWLILEAASIYDVIRPVLSPATLTPLHYYKLFAAYLHPYITFYNRDRCVEIAAVAAFATVQRENTQITGRDFLSLSHIRTLRNIYDTISATSSYFACHPAPPTSIYRVHLTKGNKL